MKQKIKLIGGLNSGRIGGGTRLARVWQTRNLVQIVLRVHVVRRVVFVGRHRVEVLAQTGAGVAHAQTSQVERVCQTQTGRAGVEARRAGIRRWIRAVEIDAAKLKLKFIFAKKGINESVNPFKDSDQFVVRLNFEKKS